MAHNELTLQKRVQYTGLKDTSTIQVRDLSPFSDNYFNIVDFPEKLTAGKNLFKIKANANNLVNNSTIHIEILDYNGNPIYYEPVNYREHDGTRVIAVYIYPDTPPGRATVYVGGRALVDASTNQRLPFSSDVNSLEYLNFPNVLWSRNVNVAPHLLNSTEIIFTQNPKITLQEVSQPYLKPVNLTNVQTSKSGSGTSTVVITPIPAAVAPVFTYPLATPAAIQGGASFKSPPPVAGQQSVAIQTTVAVTDDGSPSVITSTGPNTISDFSLLTTTGFPLSASMEGGSITIVNPKVGVQSGTGLLNNQVLPGSQFSSGYNSLGSGTQVLSGSYVFGIVDVLSTTTAKVYQISGFKNTLENTIGAWQLVANKSSTNTISAGVLQSPQSYLIDSIEASTDFTSSHNEPFVTVITDQSQSFAETIISNVEPATGDVYKIKTLYKPGGLFGDFIDAGDTIIEQTEILQDTSSYESNVAQGVAYNRIGYFTSLADFNKYWEPGTGAVTEEVQLTPTFEPDELMSGIRLTPDPSFNSTTNRFGHIHLRSQYRPTVAKDTQYILTINGYTDDSANSSDPDIPKPRLDVYISGSISADVATKEQHRLSANDISNTLQGQFADGNALGTRIATIELEPSQSLFPLSTRFLAEADENVDVYFVIRRGKWNISNLSIKTLNETGFTPNYIRLNTRIPTVFLNTPMTFKFRYFDYQGRQADAESQIFPVVFTGENTVINGDNNLLSGSLYIGNTVGSGIEMAGKNSGFIRSIGYKGFTSASAGSGSGFLMYSGSVLANKTDDYSSGGVGLELVLDSSSYFRFRTDPSELDIRTEKFFLGSDTQFISGAAGNIEISSSNFHLSNAGDVTMQGTITAEAGGTIGGFTIGANKLSTPGFEIGDSTQAYALSSSKFNVNHTGVMTASAGRVGTWTINSHTLHSEFYDPASPTGSSSYGLGLTAGGTPALTLSVSESLANISIYYTSETNYGLRALDGNLTIPFQLGSTNQIAGWSFDNSRISSSNLIMHSSGRIETADFVSSELAAGKGWRIDSDGKAEFENAVIRGTLSTAVFEKDTVSAVGGQVIIANATTISGSDVVGTDTKIYVDGIGGFTGSEYIVAKSISDTGFSTEYMQITSTGSDATGPFMNVTRNVSGTLIPTMSVGQVIVSQGVKDTGYIHLNADPSDTSTPYIDIAERTGSGIDDIEVKARLGDLSGISSAKLFGSTSPGFGLFSENVFLTGGITANTGSIGGISMESNKLFIGAGNYNNADTAFYTDDQGQFSLKDKLTWDGSSLTVKGSITIEAGSTSAVDFGAGAAASASNAQSTANTAETNAQTGITNAATAQSTADTAETNAQTGITNAATAQTLADTNAGLIPNTSAGLIDITPSPTGTGLYLGAKNLGYYDSSNWTTYMSSSGDFYLGGTDSNAGLSWDASTDILTIAGESNGFNTIFYEDFSTYANVGATTSSGDDPKTDGSGDGWHAYQGPTVTKALVSNQGHIKGTSALQLGNDSGNDRVWLSSNQLIPFNPNSLYEIEVRVKKSTTDGSPGLEYCGVTGYNINGTTKENTAGVDSFSGQHYFTLSGLNVATDAGTDTWKIYKGYFKGKASSGNGGNHNTITDPGTMHDDVDYFAPLFITNHDNDAGICHVDYIRVSEYQAGGGSTRISGDSISTGKIKSNNFSSTQGTEMDLNGEKITFGGSNVGTSSQGLIIDGSNSNLKFYGNGTVSILTIDDNVDGNNPGIAISDGVLQIDRQSSLGTNEAVMYVKQSNSGPAGSEDLGLYVGISDGTLDSDWSSYSVVSEVSLLARQCSTGLGSQCFNGGTKIGAIIKADASLATGTIAKNNAIALIADASAYDGYAYSLYGKGKIYSNGGDWGGLFVTSSGGYYNTHLKHAGSVPMVLQLEATTLSNAGRFISFHGPNGELGYVRPNGSSYVSYLTSDARLKENILPTQYGLSELLDIDVRDFTWKDGGSQDTGFIAQEVYKVLPHMVDTSDPDRWYINKDAVIPLLVQGIQDQQIEVDELKNRLSNIEGILHGLTTK